MNWRTTFWLLGSALALALFVVAVERPARLARARAAETPRVLPGFDPGAVRAVEFRVASNIVASLQRTNGLWELQRGADRHAAHPALVEGLLLRLANLRGRSVLPPSEIRARPETLAEFGLLPPAAAAVFHSASGPVELRFGTHSVNGSQVFFQVSDHPGIFVADAILLDRLPVQYEGWRDTTLLPLAQLDFDRLRVVSAGAAFTLARGPSNAVWQLVEPRPARADSLRIGVLLRQLSQIQITRFLDSNAAPAPEAAGLRPPRLAFSLARGTNEVFSLALGLPFTNPPPALESAAGLDAVAAANTPAPPPLVLARRSPESDTLAVPSEAFDLLHIPYKDLLDRRLVRCDRQAVRELEFAARESFRLVRLDDAWHLQPGNIPADPELVANLFSHLASLEILDIAKEVVTDLDLANYGLAPPATRIALLAAPGDTNTALARLEIGPPRGTTVFARVPGEAPVYLLNPADLESLPTHAWQLRDRQPWRFDAAQVVSITARMTGLDWPLRRQATNEWAGPPGLRANINPFALEESLHRIGHLRALAWVGEGDARAAALGIGRGPEFTLEFRPSPAGPVPPLLFSVGKRTPGGNRFAATRLSDGPRLIFEIAGTAFDDLWRDLGLADTPPPL